MASERPILLVEDNPDDEALTLHALSRNRISSPVVVAHDGVEAVEYLFSTGSRAGQTLPPLPAVVLLDLKLPRIDGLEVLRRIRADERTALLPVVVLTTSREEQDRFSSFNLGVAGYMIKPVDYLQFVEVIRAINLYWTLSELP